MDYTVRFENEENATAPARWIRVFDTLDENLDLDTFEIKEFCLAGNLVAVGDGRKSYNQRVLISVIGKDVLVDVAINLDEETRQLTASFMAIDPETGYMLMDVTNGLLFPNDASGRGDGHIRYAADLVDGVTTGTEVTNMAKIYFDFNDPINTPEVSNTIDATDPLAAEYLVSCEYATITLNLSGADADSGVGGYAVEYSTDGTNFSELCDIRDDVYQFEGTTKTCYYFRIRTRDNVGNLSEWSEVKQIVTSGPPPEKPVAAADVTTATNGNVVISTVFSGDSLVREYSLDGKNWQTYTDAVTVSENGTVYFRGTDIIGQFSEIEAVEVTNIDRIPPAIELTGDNTTPLRMSTLTARTEAGLDIFYSTDNQTWTKYTGEISVIANSMYYFRATDVAGNTGTNFLAFDNIIQAPVLDVVPRTQTWEKIEGTTHYIVDYSMDNFENVIRVVVDSNALDSYQMPAGSYQVRVKPADGDWTMFEPIVAPEASTEPKIVKSNEDGNDDLFFATANGTWESIYYAQHVGSINDWIGTNEIISANGKGRIQNLFFGSSDPNVLCLTDEENGDAIFVDDVYTDLPEGIEEHTARLYKIQEVRAGFGDDIVDMTSQRFEYVGDGLTICGGDGDDTIWANKGDNFLFGDAGNDRIVGASGNDVIVGGIGNDRMHGGGGDDIFTFCDNWGTDTVEQLSGGSVTLWFANGDESKWNAETLTYTDGDNTVTVKGVASVTLKFGGVGDDAAMFATLSEAGAFKEFTSQKIFEENKGLLA